ncbi:hypothetical protein SUGI_0459200 [Cryptomeria japonica]|uniref:uncharacterized protein LOC131032688 isoform X2 n=1 Tax=Cryptomeria japonica TaxID=3369 RepID=UPI002408ED88|nr:uncharacterized protein LOC131032688 isoform X2 [Cryptomeria japonica]GLJ24077.1 hypothetical protein SUGI_0459200 [Cryptomeria japonica]
MALYRQGNGSVQVDKERSASAFRANANGGNYTSNNNSNVNNNNNTLRHKLNHRGRKLSRFGLPRISQCSIGVFLVIFCTLVFITLLGGNYPSGDRGEEHASETGDLYYQAHSSHFSFWNSRGQDRSLTSTNEYKLGSGGNEIPEQKGVTKHKEDTVDSDSIKNPKILHFGQGSAGSGRDSRYWDRDDRRRDEKYNEEDSDFSNADSNTKQNEISQDKERNNIGYGRKDKQENEKIEVKHLMHQEENAKSTRMPINQDFGDGGLYNEKGRDELKLYEEKYEAALKHELDLDRTEKEKNADGLNKELGKAGTANGGKDRKDVSADNRHSWSRNMNGDSTQEQVDLDDEYDDGFDDDDMHAEETEILSNEQDIQKIADKLSEKARHYDRKDSIENDKNTDGNKMSLKDLQVGKNRVLDNHFEKESTLLLRGFHQDKVKGTLIINPQLEGSSRKAHSDKKKSSLKRRTKSHKHSSVSCELKFLNSTSQLVEPEENSRFAIFSLQYVENEEKPDGVEVWEPRFGGHQSLAEREASFNARDQKIHCGFVNGPKGSPSTGFDLSEKDAQFLNTCHIAVSSCIFGNSDNLRTPPGKKVTQSSKKNVCFVMFIDERTLNTMSAEGRHPDDKGYIGLWKIVVVRNLPFTDMRRSGKVPKFLTHRLFPSARYSIWLDSKLRLQSDPLQILEYFLWRRGFEYAISNHYDRHCVWEEVIQNKKLNKFNHTIIDDQFAFYQADGLTRFNATDPNKLLPSHVPEGSFIVRAHTPMSNLFSCLWFNEVDRFTPRDQLSFAYTYLKLWRMNPDKRFRLNMFKDCERRGMAKLFHHRTDDRPSTEKSTSL